MAHGVPTLIAADDAGNDVEYDAWADVVALINSINAGSAQGFKNRLINGCAAVNQEGNASAADDAYMFDGWYALTQTGAIAPSQVSNPENGSVTAGRLTQSQASAQRMGFGQIIETLACRDLRGAQATLSGRLRASASLTVRFAILEWTGTADTVTSDVVNDWTSSTFTTGNFFISTTTNLLAAGSLALTANTWADLTALTATCGSSMNNLIVVVWTDATAAQNVTLDFSRMQLEPGAVATHFETLAPGVEITRCERWYEKSYNLANAPGAVTLVSAYHFRAEVSGDIRLSYPTPARRQRRRIRCSWSASAAQPARTPRTSG